MVDRYPLFRFYIDWIKCHGRWCQNMSLQLHGNKKKFCFYFENSYQVKLSLKEYVPKDHL